MNTCLSMLLKREKCDRMTRKTKDVDFRKPCAGGAALLPLNRKAVAFAPFPRSFGISFRGIFSSRFHFWVPGESISYWSLQSTELGIGV
jgi:hypothetical protein